LFVEKQKALPLKYNEIFMDCGFRIDLFVEKSVIIEIKTVDSISNVHLAQVMTYLKLSQSKLGYLINFNVKLLKNGVKRVVFNL
jgi:GxxExxY protein